MSTIQGAEVNFVKLYSLSQVFAIQDSNSSALQLTFMNLDRGKAANRSMRQSLLRVL